MHLLAREDIEMEDHSNNTKAEDEGNDIEVKDDGDDTEVGDDCNDDDSDSTMSIEFPPPVYCRKIRISRSS